MTYDDEQPPTLNGQSPDVPGEPTGTPKAGTVKTGAPSGPPVGNVNAQTSGIHSSTLPKGCKSIERDGYKLRAACEAAVLAAGGSLDLLTVATINTAVRWSTHGALAARWLRMNADTMGDDLRLNYSREVVKASAERDKCLARLGATATPDDDWSAVR